MTPRALAPIAALLISSALLAAPAYAQPEASYRKLSAAEEQAVVNQKAYVPAGLGLTDTYVQDFPPQGFEVLLCYDAAFDPLMLPKAPGAWMAMQGNGGVGMGAYLYQYPTAKAAASAGKTLMTTQCAAKGNDPKWKLQQTQRTLPTKHGAQGMLITTTMVDDGALETTEQAVRQIGLVVLKVGATFNGKPDSALGKKVRPALVKALDELTANYVKAAKG